MASENEHFEALPTPSSDVYSGTAKEWYNSAIGQSFECDCGERFTIQERHVSLSPSGDPPTILERLASKMNGDNPYNVSDETVEDGLFTSDGALVQGMVVCPFCLYQHGHHHDWLQDAGITPP